MHKPIFLFIVLSVSLITIIAATNCVFDTVLNTSSVQIVSAHVSNDYGNITVEVGWDQEPPLVDEMNDIVVGVTRTSDVGGGSATPVRNALTDMDIMVRYGGVTKPLDFVPSQERAGWYEAKILPTRIGSYSFALNGTIQSQSISDEVEIEDVESKQQVSFPETRSGSGSSGDAANANLFNGQISTILNQITNDVNNIRKDIGTLAESNSDIEEGIQNVKEIAERAYMLAITAIGVGAAGILIAAAALVRTR
ncbi:MAG: hypothetical protein ACRD8Z_00670 [Nitrososphaeraceae archaeon]